MGVVSHCFYYFSGLAQSLSFGFVGVVNHCFSYFSGLAQSLCHRVLWVWSATVFLSFLS